MKNRKLWNIFHAIHLYSGLVIGAFLLLISLTGSILAFDHDIDRALNPELLTVNPGTKVRPLSEILAVARTVYPDKPAALIRPPVAADDVYVVWFKTPKVDAEGKTCCSGFDFFQVMVDPYTASITGHRDRIHYELSRPGFIRLMEGLHGKFLLGDTGKVAAGLVALAWLILTLIGIYLWWPGVRKIKLALSIKRTSGSARFIFDLHRTFGMYSLVVMVVLAFSGVYFAFPDDVKSVVKVFSPVSEKGVSYKSRSTSAEGRLSADAAVSIAQERFPGVELRVVSLPMDDKGSYAVTFRQQDEVKRPHGGKSTVWVDQYSGKVLAVRDAYQLTAGDTFINWQMPLHSGSAFGLVGRIIVCLSGLICALLIVTGTLIWLRKHNKKTAKATKKQTTTAVAASPQTQSV